MKNEKIKFLFENDHFNKRNLNVKLAIFFEKKDCKKFVLSSWLVVYRYVRKTLNEMS